MTHRPFSHPELGRLRTGWSTPEIGRNRAGSYQTIEVVSAARAAEPTQAFRPPGRRAAPAHRPRAGAWPGELPDCPLACSSSPGFGGRCHAGPAIAIETSHRRLPTLRFAVHPTLSPGARWIPRCGWRLPPAQLTPMGDSRRAPMIGITRGRLPYCMGDFDSGGPSSVEEEDPLG
jgi:hypothetical protein